MNAKMMSMLLAVVVLFALVGCKKEPTAGPGKTTRDTQTTTKSQTPSTTERAQQPAAVGGADANQTAAGRAQKQAREAAGTASDALAQQKQEYVQGAEQIVKGLEQKMTTLQQQASSLGQDGQQKAQQLQQRAQQELSFAVKLKIGLPSDESLPRFPSLEQMASATSKLGANMRV